MEYRLFFSLIYRKLSTETRIISTHDLKTNVDKVAVKMLLKYKDLNLNVLSSCICEKSNCKSAAHIVQTHKCRTIKKRLKKSRTFADADIPQILLEETRCSQIHCLNILLIWKCVLECYCVGRSVECSHNLSFIARYEKHNSL